MRSRRCFQPTLRTRAARATPTRSGWRTTRFRTDRRCRRASSLITRRASTTRRSQRARSLRADVQRLSRQSWCGAARRRCGCQRMRHVPRGVRAEVQHERPQGALRQGLRRVPQQSRRAEAERRHARRLRPRRLRDVPRRGRQNRQGCVGRRGDARRHRAAEDRHRTDRLAHRACEERRHRGERPAARLERSGRRSSRSRAPKCTRSRRRS